MGGGPDKEHMVIVLWEPEPKETIAQIKEKFPYIEVTYFQIKSYRANTVTEGVPKGRAAPFRYNRILVSSALIPSILTPRSLALHMRLSLHDIMNERP